LGSGSLPSPSQRLRSAPGRQNQTCRPFLVCATMLSSSGCPPRSIRSCAARSVSTSATRKSGGIRIAMPVVPTCSLKDRSNASSSSYVGCAVERVLVRPALAVDAAVRLLADQREDVEPGLHVVGGSLAEVGRMRTDAGSQGVLSGDEGPAEPLSTAALGGAGPGSWSDWGATPERAASRADVVRPFGASP
jgi:hypothetical protein